MAGGALWLMMVVGGVVPVDRTFEPGFISSEVLLSSSCFLLSSTSLSFLAHATVRCLLSCISANAFPTRRGLLVSRSI
jgi:hypothetical protein